MRSLPPNIWLRRGDLVLTAGDTLLGRLIRWGQRSWGEPPSVVNHALGIVVSGWVHPIIPEHAFAKGLAKIVESDWRVRDGTLWQHHAADKIWVFRPMNMTKLDIEMICYGVEQKIGRLYGLGQILGQLIDHKIFFGWPVVRWLFRFSPLDVCSRLWVEEFGKRGYHFGVPDFTATPDDIWDFCINSNKYMRIYGEWLQPPSLATSR